MTCFYSKTIILFFVLLSLGIPKAVWAISFVSHRLKGIPYKSASVPGFNPEKNRLDVYRPNGQRTQAAPVVVFIHGGNWNSGSKNIYWFIGRRLAKQGIVAVIPSYRLSPEVQVPAMANDCAEAVLWVRNHIADYGGDPNRIYVMGHSAGGGLAALLATDNSLFTKLGLTDNPIRGAILNDPAGINMYDYLQEMKYPSDRQYLTSFGEKPDGWRALSPYYQVRAGAPPMLLFVGEKTYPSIIAGTKALHEKLQTLNVPTQYTVLPGKQHVPMVKQLFWKRNIIYRETLRLVNGRI
jgi:acetyl esterase/lipase